jgi:pyruvyltransferase
MNTFSRLFNQFRPAIKLHWWRLEGSTHGNFGDEITREIIASIFGRRAEWTPADTCEMIGAGSIIEEVTQNKGSNQPFLWTSGFIQEGDLAISDKDYKIIGVRGKQSLSRVSTTNDAVTIGDAGLLASYLLNTQPAKKYRLGILPHYVDAQLDAVQRFKDDPTVHIIDATAPCRQVVREIAECDALLSSSLHGLIVADSVGTPNLHFKLSDNLKGGSYKFQDYFSVFEDPDRYTVVTPDTLSQMDATAVTTYVIDSYHSVPAEELQSIKQRLIDAFPLK